MRTPFLIGATVLTLLAAGCAGGSDEAAPAGQTASAGVGQTDSPGDDELGVSRAGWKTDFSRHTVSLSEFQGGGPGKDGIPALDDPSFAGVDAAGAWLEAREPVLELELGGEARAYPLQILIWHEIVNDEITGTPLAVTFCPLCNTAIVFDRRLRGRLLDFGTTGNLRNSDLVMYDRQTESWWQQFGGEAVVGDLAGAKLEKVPARIVAWEDFASAHPDGRVLDRPKTGDGSFERPYGQNPYAGYDDVGSPPFFGAANSGDRRLLPKERVVFVDRGGEAVAMPFSVLTRRKTLEVQVGGERLEVVWKPGPRSALDAAQVAGGREVGSAEVRTAEGGKLVAFDTPFWFAVAAFEPDVRIVR